MSSFCLKASCYLTIFFLLFILSCREKGAKGDGMMTIKLEGVKDKTSNALTNEEKKEKTSVTTEEDISIGGTTEVEDTESTSADDTESVSTNDAESVSTNNAESVSTHDTESASTYATESSETLASGCTDDRYCEYDETAQTSDDSCSVLTTNDSDCDGIPNDEEESGCMDNSYCEYAEQAETSLSDECLTLVSGDQDCDGYITEEDCDDNDPNSSALETDADCDAILDSDDACDTSDPNWSKSDSDFSDEDSDGCWFKENSELSEDCCDSVDQSSCTSVLLVSEDLDCDAIADSNDIDDDDDGYCDDDTSNSGAEMDIDTESDDTDCDGVENSEDLDADGDGVCDNSDYLMGSDDGEDQDCDDVVNEDDACDDTEFGSTDTDTDGCDDDNDTDDDGDGIYDSFDTCQLGGTPAFVLTGSDGSSNYYAQVYSQDANGIYVLDSTRSSNLTGVEDTASIMGDLDGDGDKDLIISGNDGSSATTNIYENTGSTFSSNTTTSLQVLYRGCLALADLDDDDDLDIIISGQQSSTGTDVGMNIYTNDGDFSFTALDNTNFSGVKNCSIAVSDFDGNGYVDILIAGDETSSTISSKIYFNNGTSILDSSSYTDASYDLSALTPVKNAEVNIADLDSDGDDDIILTGINSDSDFVSEIHLNDLDNSGSFVAATLSSSLVAVRDASISLADFDNDNDVDFLIAGQDASVGKSVNVYMNEGYSSDTLSLTVDDESDTGLQIIKQGASAVADFNGDGLTDVLLSGYTGSKKILKIYFNDSDGTSFTEDTSSSLTGAYKGFLSVFCL